MTVRPGRETVASTIIMLTPPKFSSQQATMVELALRQQFSMDVTHREFVFDLENAFDRTRGQHLSAAVLRQMRADLSPPDDVKVLGIMDVDLYAPVLTFVFGEAQLGGSCAILSTFRLRNEFYGIPPDAGALQQRLLKESIHETGHLFGLIHCHTFDCVMRSSTYVEEIDLKSGNLCRECRKKLSSVEILNNEMLSGMRSEKVSHS